jgi:hypothetical protein
MRWSFDLRGGFPIHFTRLSMKALPFAAATLFLVLIGCGRSNPSGKPVLVDGAIKQTPAVIESRSEIASQWKHEFEPISQEDAPGKAPLGAGQQKPQPKVARKVQHTADLKLITDDFDAKRDELQRLILKHEGYEAMADVRSSPGSQRVGTWRVRLPVEHFSAFRDAVRKVAEVETDTVNTEDLTDQYYDLEANIKNLKAEQDSWREMLKKTSDKLENLISVKRELDRVTDEIQRKEGRLRLMANLTDLTTINLTLRERQRFTPDKGPEVVEAATFGMRAGKTFEESWGALRGFGEGLALLGIALAPWLPVILVAGIPVWYSWRQWRKQVRTAAAVPVTPATPG